MYAAVTISSHLHAGHTECVEVLLEAGCAVDAVTTSGSTALHSAASNGHALVVQRLITAGADVDVQVSSGSSPMCTVPVPAILTNSHCSSTKSCVINNVCL